MNRFNAVFAATTSLVAALAVAMMMPEPVAAAMLSLRIVSVPEPATTALIAAGLAGVAMEARRRRKNKDD